MEPDSYSKQNQSTDRIDESYSKHHSQNNSLSDDKSLTPPNLNKLFEDGCMGISRTFASSSTTLESDFLSSPSSSSSLNLSEDDTRNQNKTPKGASLSGKPTVTPSCEDGAKSKSNTYPPRRQDEDTSTSPLTVAALIEEFSTDNFYYSNDISSIKKQNARTEAALTRSINELPAEHHALIDLLIKRAKSLIYQRKYEKCLSDCVMAIKLAYKNTASTNREELIRALLCKAQALKDLERYEAAIVTYEEVVFLNFSFNASLAVQINLCEQALFNSLGDCSYEAGEFKDSEDYFTRAINVSPTKSNDLVLLWNKRAAAYMKQGQHIDCLKDCESSIELALNNLERRTQVTLLVKNSRTTIEEMLPEAIFRKAQALEALDRYQEAIQSYGKAKSYDYTREAQTREAIHRCRQVMFKEQGSKSFKKGSFKQAEEAYTHAIKDLPSKHGDLVLLLNNRAATFLKQKNYENSLKDCESAIKLAKEMVRNKAPVTFLMKKSATTINVQLVKALLRKAKSLEALNRPEGAIQIYNAVLDDDGRNLQAKEGRAQCHRSLYKNEGDLFFKQKEYNSAVESYTRALEATNSRDCDAVILLNNRAAALIEQEKCGPGYRDCVAAIDLAKYCIKINAPMTPIMERTVTTTHIQLVKALTRKAQSLKGLKRYEDAIQAFEESMRLDAMNCTQMMKGIRECKRVLYKEQGDSFLKKYEFSKAEESYTNAIDISSTENMELLELLNNRASAFLNQNKFTDCLKDSETAFSLASRINDRNPPAKRNDEAAINQQISTSNLHKAQALEALNRNQEAMKAYEEALKMCHSADTEKKIRNSIYICKYSLYKEEGNSLFKRGLYAQAVIYYTYAIELVPTNDDDMIPVLNNRAAALLEQDKYEECLRDCISTIKLLKGHIENGKPVGRIMERTGVTLAGQLIKAMLRKARALEGLNRYLEAIQSYEASLKLGYDNNKQIKASIQKCKQALYKEEGDNSMMKGEFGKAEVSYTNAIEISPSESKDLLQLWNSRAKAFMKQRKYENCLKDCSSAIESAYSKLNDDIPAKTTIKKLLVQALFYKAFALEKMEKYEAAIAVYENIVSEDSSWRKEVLENIKRCRALQTKKTKDDAATYVSDTVKEMREQEIKKKAEEAEKLAKEEVVNKKIYLWNNDKKQGDLRALLCSLESILWPEVLVKGIGINESSSASECKKLYKRVITKIHPDKLPKTSTVEQRLLATRVFQILDESWKQFKVTHGL